MITDEVTSDVVDKKAMNLVSHWLGEIDAAAKREKDFRREGARINALYEGEKKAEYQFNILYSNTETIGPAVYNSLPRPVVQRRFKDEDPLGMMASKAGGRLLEYLIDDGSSEYSSFDDLMKSAVLEALLPGRGLTRFKYDAVFEKLQNQKEAESAEASDDNGDEEREKSGLPESAQESEEHVTYETVCGEEVPWDRFYHGYARKWKNVPWIAYEHYMTREELEANFGAIGTRVPVSEMTENEDDEGGKKKEETGMKGACVYEIWDKITKKVYFVSPSYKESPLKAVDDPLGLSGFFNCPKPLSFTQKVTGLIPTPMYLMYEEQAKELNTITVRINKIVKALKVRGIYDSTIEGLEKVFESEDNTLIPAQNLAALLAQGNSLEKGIWLVPIEKFVGVLQQLYVQREQVKQVIYEVTGIADIMRGSSQASETLGAQQLKNQWGTLRLKRLQKEVARYARDCLRIMLEIAVSKLAVDTIKGATGLPYPKQEEKDRVQAQIEQMRPMMGDKPVPPAVQELLKAPSWEDLIGLLQNDLQRSYRIDIETNSTVDAEATEDKQNIAELLNAISQFLNGVAPLVTSGQMPFEVASSMLLAIVRRFRFGPELEDQLKAMKPPPQPPPDPKIEADKAAAAVDLQMKQLDMQAKQQDIQSKQAQAAMQQETMRLEAEYRAAEHQQKMDEIARKSEAAAYQHMQKMAQIRATAEAAARKSAEVTNS